MIDDFITAGCNDVYVALAFQGASIAPRSKLKLTTIDRDKIRPTIDTKLDLKAELAHDCDTNTSRQREERRGEERQGGRRE